jgi:hypothetical protein
MEGWASSLEEILFWARIQLFRCRMYDVLELKFWLGLKCGGDFQVLSRSLLFPFGLKRFACKSKEKGTVHARIARHSQCFERVWHVVFRRIAHVCSLDHVPKAMCSSLSDRYGEREC